MNTVVGQSKRELPKRHWEVIPFGLIAVMLCAITGFRNLAEVLSLIVISYLTFLITVEFIDRYYAHHIIAIDMHLGLPRGAISSLLDGNSHECQQEFDVSPMKIKMNVKFVYASDEELMELAMQQAKEDVPEGANDYAFQD